MGFPGVITPLNGAGRGPPLQFPGSQWIWKSIWEFRWWWPVWLEHPVSRDQRNPDMYQIRRVRNTQISLMEPIGSIYGIFTYMKTIKINHSCRLIPSLKLTAKAPENGWLEYDPFVLGFRPIFRGELLVSGGVSLTLALKKNQHTWRKQKFWTDSKCSRCQDSTTHLQF